MPSRTASTVLQSDESRKTFIVLLVTIIFLALDSLNPVKIIARGSGIPEYVVAYPAMVALCYIIYVNINDIVYDFARIFFKSILSIFFKQIDVVGLDNIPPTGPIIFAGNHQNQFVDGAMLVTNLPGDKRVGVMVAEKSYKQRIIGTFMKLMHCVPVKRPQDAAKKQIGFSPI